MNQKSMYGVPISLLLNQFIFTILLFLVLFYLFYQSPSFELQIATILPVLFIGYYIYFFQPNQFHKKRKQVRKHMIRLASIKGSETILDLGTGAGYIAIGFAKQLSSGEIYGLDKYHQQSDGFIHTMLEEIKINFIGNSLHHAKRNAAIEKQEKKITFQQADLTEVIPFKDNFFDVVVSSQFLYCIPHQKLPFVLSEIDRVLKKQGKIIFFESNRFMNWDLDEVIKFFEDKCYEIRKENIAVFSNKSILKGIKE